MFQAKISENWVAQFWKSETAAFSKSVDTHAFLKSDALESMVGNTGIRRPSSDGHLATGTGIIELPSDMALQPQSSAEKTRLAQPEGAFVMSTKTPLSFKDNE